MQQARIPAHVFNVAASTDASLLARWEKHLFPLQQSGYLTLWSEQHLSAGEQRTEQIYSHLEQAQIIVLLLSAEFFVSEECMDLMHEALERQQKGLVHTIPLLLRPVAWERTALAELAYLPANGRPITIWDNIDRAFQTCVDGLFQLLDAQETRSNKPDLRTDPPVEQESGTQSRYSISLAQKQHFVDWNGEFISHQFYGRKKEKKLLAQWIMDDHCKLIAVLGIGGMGKTALTLQVVEQIKGQFDAIFLRSLHNAPPLEDTLDQCLLFFSQQKASIQTSSVEQKMELFMEYLRANRCLLVLDNVETILREGNHSEYRDGYEGYGQLLWRIGTVEHKSCLLLTSREKSREITQLDRATSPVRALNLSGLGKEGLKILKSKKLVGSETLLLSIVQQYSGNPLALQIVAEHIKEVFGGSAAGFLAEATILTVDIYELLRQQFTRLSRLEQDILFWLAIEREAISVTALQENLVDWTLKRVVLDALESLRQRNLLERNDANMFSLQPVILEFVTSQFIDQVSLELASENLVVFRSHALIKALAKDYNRQSQIQLVLTPIASQMLHIFQSKEAIAARLRDILASQRNKTAVSAGYVAGNVLNFLCYLSNDINGADFSHLTIRQAYLQGSSLQNTSFAHANFSESVFTSTFGIVLSIVLSPEGEFIAVGTGSGELHIWQASDNTPLFVCAAHTDWIRALAFSPDSSFIVSCGDDNLIALWDFRTGVCLGRIEDKANKVWSLAIRQEGDIIASSGNNPLIKLWDAHTCQQLGILQEHTDAIRSIAFSPDGSTLASGSDDQTIKFWDISSRKCLRTLSGHTHWVRALAFSPDGSLLASASDDKTIKFWDVASGECRETLFGHTHWVRSLAFSPDGSFLASGSEDQTIKLWNVSSGECLKTLYGHTQTIRAVAFKHDQRTLISGSDDQSMRWWDIPGGECAKIVQSYSNYANLIAISPDGHLLAGGFSDGDVRILHLDTGTFAKPLRGHTDEVEMAVFSPDGHRLASSSHDYSIRIWDLHTRQCLMKLQGHTNWVKAVSFSPDGQQLASGSDDKLIKIWDAYTGRCLKTLPGHTHRVKAVSFSPDGQRLVSGGDDKLIKLWDVHTGQCLKTLFEHSGWVKSVSFSPDGFLLASASEDQTVRLWAMPEGECIQVLQDNNSLILAVAFAHDSSILAYGGGECIIKLWNIHTNQYLSPLCGHTGDITGLAFVPSSSLLASSSVDGSIRLWETQTGQCLAQYRADRAYENMDITGATGLTGAQKTALLSLGAFDSN